MRNALGQRCLWTTFAMAAGFLPFAPSLAWDRLIVPSESSASTSRPLPTNANASVRHEVRPDSPKEADLRACELTHAGSGGRWSLPLDADTREWLVAVGITSRDSKDHRIRLSARTSLRPVSSADAKTGIRSFESHIANRPGVRHVVARHRGTGTPERQIVPPANRRFAIQTRSGEPTDPAFYETIESRLVKAGKRVAIYVDDRDLETVSPDAIDMIVRTMDESIPARVETRIGSVEDVDGDGRLTILLSQVLGRMAEGTTVLDGFVRTSDFEKAGQFPRSHACDLIYLNSRVQAGPFLKSLLAHEYTHAVIASARSASSTAASPEPEESWLDEGLAHLSERWIDENWENLDYRIAEFLANPHEHRLIVNDQIGLAIGRSHGHRGAAYLFLEWCQSRFGDDLPARLVRSSKSGVANLESATGMSFELLFREWTVSLMNQSAAIGESESIRSQALRDDWLVGVPRSTDLAAPVDGQPVESDWTGEGSTVRIFRISATHANDQTASIELMLEAAPESQVQITAMPLTGTHSGLAMEVLPSHEFRDGTESVVRLRFTNLDTKRSLKIQAAAWESLIPGLDARELRNRRGIFEILELARSLGTITIGPGQSLVSLPIEFARSIDRTDPVRWKAVAHDDLGRAVFSWCEMTSEHRSKSRPPRIAVDLPSGGAAPVRR